MSSIIGLGNMAGALADRALAGGNAVEIIGRDQAKAKELAAALGGGVSIVGAIGLAIGLADIRLSACPNSTIRPPACDGHAKHPLIGRRVRSGMPGG
jgi:3-hydroxyisobutyrate dehydrogenase-like beta-hydroxyacid dehydrogenase